MEPLSFYFTETLKTAAAFRNRYMSFHAHITYTQLVRGGMVKTQEVINRLQSGGLQIKMQKHLMRVFRSS